MLLARAKNPTARLIDDSLAILAKYGTDAHAYIFGLGSINGLTAGNYLESTASTAATVDGLAGFLTDAYQGATLGAELWDGVGETVEADWVDNGDGSYTHTGGGGVGTVRDNIGLVAGTTYQVSVTCAGRTAGAVYVVLGGSVSGPVESTNGTFTYRIASGVNALFYIQPDTNFNGTISGISVKKVPGIHATQDTTANKPILRQSGSLYYGQFDGSNDYLSLGSVPFQMSDDHLTIVCAKANAASGTLVSIGSSSSNTPRVAEISVDASGYAVASWIDDAATTATITGSTDLRGSVKVYRASKSGNNKTLHIDGVQIGSTNTTAMGATTVNTARIGATAIATPSLFLNGNVYCRFDLKGAWTEAEAATLERFAGLFGGLSI